MIKNKLSRPISELRGLDANQPGAVSSGKISFLAQQMKSFFTSANKELDTEQEKYFDILKKEAVQRDIYHKEILLVILQATTKKKFGEQKIKEKTLKKTEREVKKEEKPAPPTKKEVPAPKPEAPAPKPEAPAPKTQAPAPKPEAPAPKTQAPAPKPEAPAPKPEAPAPKTQAPAPKPEAPAPKTQAPAPKPEAPSPAPPPTAKPVGGAPPAPAAPPTATPAPPGIGGAAKTAAKIATGVTLGVFSSQQAFSREMFPAAEKASKKMGGTVPPEALVTQWALESGWGKRPSGDYNYFGLKANKGWTGGKKLVQTTEFFTEQQAKQFESMGDGRKILSVGEPGKKSGTKKYKVMDWFRSYSSLNEAAEDKADFLMKQPRYREALKSTTSEEYFNRMAAAEYATDQTYAQSLSKTLPGIKKFIPAQTSDVTNRLAGKSDAIDSMSKENAGMKKDMAQTPGGGSVIMQQNNNNTTQTTNVISPKRQDNTNPILR